jgi:uncharacterized protein
MQPLVSEIDAQKANRIVSIARDGLAALCEKARIPESHGLGHASRVLAHVEEALAAVAGSAPAGGCSGGKRRRVHDIPLARALAVRLAALLHDADDRKYFRDCAKGSYPNAERLMREALGPVADSDESVIRDAVRMISLVSCSSNGNTVPLDAKEEPELLWPRWADRLEATGEIGIIRCWQFNKEVSAPLVSTETPRPRDEEEVWSYATPERFARYQSTGGESASMMDHYYDKLLRVARPPVDAVQNSYLEAEMAKRASPLVKVCLDYGRTGEVPLDDLSVTEMAANLGGA